MARNHGSVFSSKKATVMLCGCVKKRQTILLMPVIMSGDAVIILINAFTLMIECETMKKMHTGLLDVTIDL